MILAVRKTSVFAFAVFTAVWSVGDAGVSQAAAQPTTTRPARQVAKADDRQAGRVLRNLRAVLEDLDLTEDQKAKIDSAFETLRDKAKAGATNREDVRSALDGIRQELLTILTPAQRESVRDKLQQAMRAGGGGGGAGGGGGLAEEVGRRRGGKSPATMPGGERDEMSPRAMGGGKMSEMSDSGMMGAGAGGAGAGDTGVGDAMSDSMMSTAKDAAGRPRRSGSAQGGGSRGGAGAPVAEVGQPAPEIRAKKLDGTSFTLTNVRDRPVVLVFASYSTPTFRDKAPLLENLAREFKGRMDVIVVYTAEAFPTGSSSGEGSGPGPIERNTDDKVSIEPHASESARIEQAKMAKTVLKLASPTVVVDDLSDVTAKGYADTPNAAVVIGRDGTIVGRQRWLEPFALRSIMDEAVRKRTKGSDESAGN